jgi:hypothetical protein
MSMDHSKLLRRDKDTYGGDFQDHLIEQYKLYVELADRISARRMLANSFFVGLHTALITAFTVLLKEKVLASSILGMASFFTVILLCLVWWFVVISYRQLNAGKFKVVHALEQMLPVAPFDFEWEVLHHGQKWRLYLPLTFIENLVPVCFSLLYILLATTLF